ncbi:uncharacterized protein LOC126366847 [Pectinophora gossypiella]|uniref:uncharacterized protein LOC126366847 n=1 Tax=Pectinophora gossypiella TaxID=13191 RepID=UPI00214E4B4D|nr:uncharacterized protein LOC126366847 [Pectinophora gossypiella]
MASAKSQYLASYTVRYILKPVTYSRVYLPVAMCAVTFLLVIVISLLTGNAEGLSKRSVDHLISSTVQGSTVTFGERAVTDCVAAGNPAWKCYTEQRGFNPDWK